MSFFLPPNESDIVQQASFIASGIDIKKYKKVKG
jgi:hypothetical protein|tara:strand:+ start:573 stop:674 length:102 start_codon:yes stop_codon:yes gene_type:complete